nr:uncharacterized protein LOC109179738 isoform X1 [Ipomoea batatas]
MPQVKNEPNDATTQNVEILDLVATFHSMHTRAMAKTFVEANKLLTAGQCRTIVGMLFDLMLNLQITDTPLRRLGNWLLSNLDLHPMSVNLPNGCTLEVNEEVLEVVLGLPRGSKVITDRVKHEKSVILNNWGGLFGNSDYAITLVEVDLLLQEYPNGGVLYVDHVQVGGCTVPRSLPCIVRWDTTLLKEREEWEITSGGFSCREALEILRLKKKDLRIRVTEKTHIISVGFLELIELLHEAEMTTDKTDRHC